MKVRRPSSRALLAVAFLVAQGCTAWIVWGVQSRASEIVETQRLDAINDCVEERRDARELELESVGLQAIASEPGPQRDALVERLRQPARPADETFAEDFAWCEAKVAPGE